jgi:hypothetical protein
MQVLNSIYDYIIEEYKTSENLFFLKKLLTVLVNNYLGKQQKGIEVIINFMVPYLNVLEGSSREMTEALLNLQKSSLGVRIRVEHFTDEKLYVTSLELVSSPGWTQEDLDIFTYQVGEHVLQEVFLGLEYLLLDLYGEYWTVRNFKEHVGILQMNSSLIVPTEVESLVNNYGLNKNGRYKVK